MDLQVYYQKIRETEAKMADEFPLVVSMETADGGKSGTTTEVPRRLAAKMLVEGKSVDPSVRRQHGGKGSPIRNRRHGACRCCYLQYRDGFDQCSGRQLYFPWRPGSVGQSPP